MSSSLSRRPRVEDLADARFGPDQVDGELGVPGRVAVADQHGHVRGDPLGAERGGGEGRGHREEDHRTALSRRQERAALTSRHVDADHGHVGRPARRADRLADADRVGRVGDHHLVGQAAAADSEPLLPAAPNTATTGPLPEVPVVLGRGDGPPEPPGTMSPSRPADCDTTRWVSAGAPQTSITASDRGTGRSSGSTAAIERPNKIAWPWHGTCSDRPSHALSPSVITSGVRLSETRVAIRSPGARPSGESGPTSRTVPVSIPPDPVTGF